MFIKLGELTQITRVENTDSCVAAVSPEILENFQKFAINLKKIAPKAEDFLYFSAVMMHSAEAAALNDDGTQKLTIRGEPVIVGWDTSNGSWKWKSNDPNLKPYKNSNGDIFPEAELVKAYKKWVGKPLCIDHKSSSVDHVRGFIVDTYYDRSLKRVVALCALDKAGYPQLARQVTTGVSSSVSMGTAVGRAICSDCGRVARAEADFCDHMRRKSCYGEINVDLNPIELSIVVNGADPKAHIKHIIAAANTLNSYVESKSQELNKLAETIYSASINIESDQGSGNASNISIKTTDLAKFKQDIDAAVSKLSDIKSSNINEDQNTTNDLALNQTGSTAVMEEVQVPNTDSALAPPHERFASAGTEDNLVKELRNITATVEEKLVQMKQSLDKLSKTNITQEENMSGDIKKQSYYQGTEEPTPGQAKYPKDPLNEKDRNDEDKQMNGAKPFPDTGSVEDLYPGDLERKKLLARAEAEERALKRVAAVAAAKEALKNKQGYFQGGGGVNEPTPGKVKYPKDKLNEDDRDNEDKQMVGQKPFPNVGPVDGMHPSPSSADVSDEKKRKEMLQRASLRARFVKSSNEDGSQNLAKSAWEVFLGDKLVLTASVADLSGGRAEVMYDSIATKDFGASLINKVKTFGAEKVGSLIKSGQDAAPALPAPEAPPADSSVPAGEAVDTGKSGDPKENAIEMAEKVRDVSSDLVEVVRALTGEQAEMGAGDAGMPAAAASDTKALNTMRKELNAALIDAAKESVASLNDHQKELDMIKDMYDSGAVTAANEDFITSIVEDAVTEAKTAVADGFTLMTAFVKYARGTKAIIKRAEIEAELEKLAEGDSTMETDKDSHSSDDLMNLIQDTNADLDAVKDMMADDNDGLEADFPADDALSVIDAVDGVDAAAVVDANDAQVTVKPEEVKTLEVKPGDKVTVASLETKEGRAMLRAKLAAETLKFNPVLDEAHPKGGFTTQLDTKPEGDLAKVETLEEVHDEMMDVATAPPKVRKEAESIHKLVSEGKLDPADLDALVAEGLDKDAVAYYKKYWAQVDGGSEFASELVKEHVKAQLETELNTYKVKMARAYELANDMVARGLCHNNRESISAQVDEIMKFNNESFESVKRVVASHSPIKQASRLPVVGTIGSGEVNTTVTDDSLSAQLTAAFSKTTKKQF